MSKEAFLHSSILKIKQMSMFHRLHITDVKLIGKGGSMKEWDLIMLGVDHLTDWKLVLEIIARIILS